MSELSLRSFYGSLAAPEVETLLISQRPFGDSGFLGRRLVATTGWSILNLDEDLFREAKLLRLQIEETSLHAARFLADPVVRDLLHDLWLSRKAARSEMRVDRRKLLELSASRWSDTCPVPPVAATLGDCPRVMVEGPWLWSPRRTDDPLAKEFATLCENAFPGLEITPLELTRREVAQLKMGGELLANTLPKLVSILAHLQIIVVVRDKTRAGDEKIFLSASRDSVGATVFLSEQMLSVPTLVAESLLHEAAHHKLFDIWSSLPILAECAYATAGLRFKIPWADTYDWNSGNWEASRALAALHVYVHLLVFFARLRSQIPSRFQLISPKEIDLRIEELRYKASFLLIELKRVSELVLRDAGRNLLGWLEEFVTLPTH